MSRSQQALSAASGIVGPVAFTAAWTLSTLRQEGYSVAEEHISGLAAPDALRPQTMVAGFLTLGLCTTVFARAVEEALGGRGAAGLAPHLIRTAGLATLAAGMLRRDRMLLHPPDGVTGQSWRNDGHDYASGVAYALIVAIPLVLANRFRRDPRWRRLAGPAVGTALTTGGLLGLFASRTLEPWNGIVQRVAVTIPGGAMLAFASHLLARESLGS